MGNFSLDIENFQSISSGKLEFVKGINLILGQSNSGKTAILRAINTVLSNPSYAKTFIKHGKNSTKVSFDFLDNHVEWLRNSKGNITYDINGESFVKAGNKDLFELLPDNGFVRSDNGDIMNIEGEWDFPFPFDKSPAELFRLFENVFCISDSATILKSYKEEEAELVKKINDVKEKVQITLKKKEALDSLKSDINLEKLKRDVLKLEEDYDKYIELYTDVATICRSELIGNFSINEKTPPENYSLDKYTLLAKDYSFLVDVFSRINFYKTLPDIMEIPSTVDQYMTMLSDYKVIYKSCAISKMDLGKDFIINENLINQYNSLLNDLKVINTGYNASKFQLEKNCHFDVSLTLAEYENLSNDLSEIMSCYRKCKSLTSRCKELNVLIENAENKLKQYKVCPLCGQSLERGN